MRHHIGYQVGRVAVRVEQSEDASPTARRYSPNKVTGSEVRILNGDPDPSLISTSYVECHNLSMRMSMRRFTRLTNGFSKKVENHAAMVSPHFMHYNVGSRLDHSGDRGAAGLDSERGTAQDQGD